FPPKPPGEQALHRILTDSSSAMQSDKFVESGCAVCGHLTPLSELTQLDCFEGSLDHLVKEGVTRKECTLSTDPIEELAGPVLADGCSHICLQCEPSVLKRAVPRHALENYGWLGVVPPQLQGLTYAKGVMIARVRHNRCVV
ncbi:hypothetical protein B0H17DRAFT_896042, partial [Mycena rosella]